MIKFGGERGVMFWYRFLNFSGQCGEKTPTNICRENAIYCGFKYPYIQYIVLLYKFRKILILQLTI